jgi:steroid delta-isomerase-like uncharacterized protein
MGVKENKDTVSRFWEEVFNSKKLNLIDNLFTEDYVYHGAAGQEVRGREGLKQFLSMYFGAFPDLHAEVEDIFGEGEKILSRATCHGTHQGQLMGMPPTGKQVAIRVICADRLAGQKVTESFELPDLFGMMQQLGAIPAQR